MTGQKEKIPRSWRNEDGNDWNEDRRNENGQQKKFVKTVFIILSSTTSNSKLFLTITFYG